ncbi:hypothetical protein LTR66_010791 [Elasticomyces elasticus]|nr:hypothetical protein LTR66_010791 [Elasticomyces elasticus]
MVLQEATASPSDSFTEDAPSSDLDPYADYSSRATPTRARLHTGTLQFDPSRLPAPFLASGLNASTIDAIQRQCNFAASALQRPLTQDESNALAFHFAKALRITSFGPPLGFAAGCVRFFQTRQKFRFPLWQPKLVADGGSFNPEKLGPLKGQLARSAWQLIRLNLYCFAGIVLGTTFYTGYGFNVGEVGKRKDPSLKELYETIARRVRNGEPVIPNEKVVPQPEPQDQSYPDGQIRRNAWRRSQQQPPRGAKKDTADDMSPTSGAFASDYSDASTDTGLLSDSQMRSQEVRQRADARHSPTENRAATFDMKKVTSQPRGFDQDDTSPVASPAGSAGGAGGSTWDRIRQQATSGTSSSNTGSAWTRNRGTTGRSDDKNEQRQGSTLGDGFGFPETEEERQSARTEAQREFDARVERERHGVLCDDTYKNQAS